MLEIKNLTKNYGDFKAVDDLSLTVQSGEIYGFIGHNGAGKSTTIKAVVGALDFEGGDVCVDGLSIKTHAIDCKKRTAYVPDNPDIYDHLTGIQYLNFIADIFGVEQQTKNELIKKYAVEFELENSLGDVISSYSHGMRQKLVLISALLHSPKLLVLDEPFVGLDPIASHKLKTIMRSMCDDGCSIFFSSHVLEVVEKLCDRVGIIKKGKLVKEGKVEDILGDKENLEELFLELQND